jgi:hypothetical protein
MDQSKYKFDKHLKDFPKLVFFYDFMAFYHLAQKIFLDCTYGGFISDHLARSSSNFEF